MTNIPPPRSMRDKYDFSSFEEGDSYEYDLKEIGDGDVLTGYNNLKTRAYEHGREHKKTFAVRKNGDKCTVYRVN